MQSEQHCSQRQCVFRKLGGLGPLGSPGSYAHAYLDVIESICLSVKNKRMQYVMTMRMLS